MSIQIASEFKEQKNKVVVKVGLLGDSQIGKTTLMVKFIEDKYDEDYIETLGVNFMEKTIHLKNVDVTISIWDLGGQREFATLMPLVCSDAKVILFAFDLTQKTSLFSVKRWYKEARRENKQFIPFLVGTKFDLFAEKQEGHKMEITHQARKFAKKMHSPLIYCSSAHSINVKKIFKIIIAKVFDLKPKMKELHNWNKEALIEFDNTNNTDGADGEEEDEENDGQPKKKGKRKKKKGKKEKKSKKHKKKSRKHKKKKNSSAEEKNTNSNDNDDEDEEDEDEDSTNSH